MIAAPARHRHPWRRLTVRVVVPLVALATTAAIAAALQVRAVRVSGTHRFPARDVEAVLRSALGTPTVAARAEALRTRVLAIPWVADATVQVSLDGVVRCAVSERQPAAVAVDAGARRWVDASGMVLGPADADLSLLELDGFGPHPDDMAALLAARPALEHTWGAPLQTAEWISYADVALHFAGTSLPVLADPRHPELLAAARRVLAAWETTRPAPARLDARVAGLVAVLPAPVPANEPATEDGQ